MSFSESLAGVLITQSVGGCYRRSLMAFLCCLVSCPVAFHMVRDIKRRGALLGITSCKNQWFCTCQKLTPGVDRELLHHLPGNQTMMHLCLPESLCSSPAHLTWSSCGEIGLGASSQGAPGLLCLNHCVPTPFLPRWCRKGAPSRV